MAGSKEHVTHTMNSKPIKHVPLAKLPDNLVERYKGRRGFEFYEQFTTAELDAAGIDAIPRDLLLREADLMKTKWFDYRIQHPWRATALFLEAYRSEHAWIMRKREDVQSHWFHKGIKAKNLHAAGSRQLISIWKARQAADSIGVPYDVYCRELIDWAEKRNWQHLPRVNQLYSEDHIEVARDLWEQSKRYKLRVATEPCFTNDAYSGEWYQDDYREFLIEQVKARPHKEFALATLIHKHQHLTEELAIQHFGHAVVERASRVASDVLTV